MSGSGDSRGPRRRIDEPAKACFLAALGRGERREDAAAAAGFTLMGCYGARQRDPAFKAAWVEALAASAADERRVPPGPERGEVRIVPANRRALQRRRRRNVRFDERAQAVFIAHFASNCDSRAAAAAAGVAESTVTLHRRTDPAFAEVYAEALQEGYAWLEAEAMRQRLEAQRRLRAAMEAAGPAATAELRAEEGAEFERVMKLLARFDRKPRRPERGFAPGGRRQHWTFEEAIALLDKRMRALGLRRSAPPPPPPPDGGED